MLRLRWPRPSLASIHLRRLRISAVRLPDGVANCGSLCLWLCAQSAGGRGERCGAFLTLLPRGVDDLVTVGGELPGEPEPGGDGWLCDLAVAGAVPRDEELPCWRGADGGHLTWTRASGASVAPELYSGRCSDCHRRDDGAHRRSQSATGSGGRYGRYPPEPGREPEGEAAVTVGPDRASRRSDVPTCLNSGHPPCRSRERAPL